MNCQHPSIQFLAATPAGVAIDLCEECGRFLVTRQSCAIVTIIGELTADELAGELEQLADLRKLLKSLAGRKMSGHLPQCPNTAGQCTCGWVTLRKRITDAAR